MSTVNSPRCYSFLYLSVKTGEKKEASNYLRSPLEGTEDQVQCERRQEKEAGCRGMKITLGWTGGGRGEESSCRIIPECEKVLRGRLAAGGGSHLLNLLQAPLFSLSVLGANS